jgi:hypothetical protein
MHLREIRWGGVGWINLAQHTEKWRAVVNTVMNVRVSKNVEDIVEWLSNWRLLKKDSAP